MVQSLQVLPYKFFHPNYSSSPPSVNTRSWELGTSERQECCYIWLGLDWEDQPTALRASTHSHVWTQWDTHTHSHAHKASVAAQTWCSSISNPSQQPAVLTARTLSSSRQREITLKANTNCFGGRLTCRPFPGIWLKWAGSQTLSSRRWEGFCHSRAAFWQRVERQISRTSYTKNSWCLYACVQWLTHLAACTALSWITALSLVAFCSDKEWRPQ